MIERRIIRILIADDHSVVRKGLKETFDEIPGMAVEAQAANGHELLHKILRQKFDVIIMDITMPGRSGLEILEDIKKRRPQTAVLIYTMHDEEEFGLRAFKAGASGYLTKERPLEELIRAVKTVEAGGKYVSPSLAQLLARDAESDPKRPSQTPLSNREYGVMRKIVSGKSLKSIANEFGLSAKTITTYRSRILRKLRLKSNAALIQYALKRRVSP